MTLVGSLLGACASPAEHGFAGRQNPIRITFA
jgi:hypothetical protein